MTAAAAHNAAVSGRRLSQNSAITKIAKGKTKNQPSRKT